MVRRPPAGLSPLSLHDALPICRDSLQTMDPCLGVEVLELRERIRSEEHTSELQSPYDLVCRLLLEKKNRYTAKCERDDDQGDSSVTRFGTGLVIVRLRSSGRSP